MYINIRKYMEIYDMHFDNVSCKIFKFGPVVLVFL